MANNLENDFVPDAVSSGSSSLEADFTPDAATPAGTGSHTVDLDTAGSMDDIGGDSAWETAKQIGTDYAPVAANVASYFLTPEIKAGQMAGRGVQLGYKALNELVKGTAGAVAYNTTQRALGTEPETPEQLRDFIFNAAGPLAVGGSKFLTRAALDSLSGPALENTVSWAKGKLAWAAKQAAAGTGLAAAGQGANVVAGKDIDPMQALREGSTITALEGGSDILNKIFGPAASKAVDALRALGKDPEQFSKALTMDPKGATAWLLSAIGRGNSTAGAREAVTKDLTGLVQEVAPSLSSADELVAANSLGGAAGAHRAGEIVNLQRGNIEAPAAVPPTAEYIGSRQALDEPGANLVKTAFNKIDPTLKYEPKGFGSPAEQHTAGAMDALSDKYQGAVDDMTDFMGGAAKTPLTDYIPQTPTSIPVASSRLQNTADQMLATLDEARITGSIRGAVQKLTDRLASQETLTVGELTNLASDIRKKIDSVPKNLGMQRQLRNLESATNDTLYEGIDAAAKEQAARNAKVAAYDAQYGFRPGTTPAPFDAPLETAQKIKEGYQGAKKLWRNGANFQHAIDTSTDRGILHPDRIPTELEKASTEMTKEVQEPMITLGRNYAGSPEAQQFRVAAPVAGTSEDIFNQIVAGKPGAADLLKNNPRLQKEVVQRALAAAQQTTEAGGVQTSKGLTAWIEANPKAIKAIAEADPVSAAQLYEMSGLTRGAGKLPNLSKQSEDMLKVSNAASSNQGPLNVSSLLETQNHIDSGALGMAVKKLPPELQQKIGSMVMAAQGGPGGQFTLDGLSQLIHGLRQENFMSGALNRDMLEAVLTPEQFARLGPLKDIVNNGLKMDAMLAATRTKIDPASEFGRKASQVSRAQAVLGEIIPRTGAQAIGAGLVGSFNPAAELIEKILLTNHSPMVQRAVRALGKASGMAAEQVENIIKQHQDQRTQKELDDIMKESSPGAYK